MTLLRKLLQEIGNKEVQPKANSAVEVEQAELAGLNSVTPLRNAAKGSMNLTYKNIVKLEKHFGYSYEELTAEVGKSQNPATHG